MEATATDVISATVDWSAVDNDGGVFAAEAAATATDGSSAWGDGLAAEAAD